MSYIIKNTSGLINTRITDVGRRKLSQGRFNIAYFQVGDSEVDYKIYPNYNQVNNNILMPAFNAQNDTGSPESNKQNIKYPYYVAGNEGTTYGIPYEDSAIQPIYNAAGSKGFFTGTTKSFSAETSSGFTITSNYTVDMTTLVGTDVITIDYGFCSDTPNVPQPNDFLTIFFDGVGNCSGFTTSPVLTYRIQEIDPASGTPTTSSYTITLDRPTPDYSVLASPGDIGKVQIYPSGMTVLYDTLTPLPNWDEDVINFETPCDVALENTQIWNMNIPWTESPAGLFNSVYEDYGYYGSLTYNGTKEYLAYSHNSGNTDTSEVYYYNSFDEKIVVEPKNQKTIAIIHYTNQSIDNVYGEKFSTIPFDPVNPTDQTGLANHFKLHIPTLMWHKSTGGTIGETFYIDPQGYDLCRPFYIRSSVNTDMNDPGIRYYHLYDTYPDDNQNLNRIGKVFPDQQIVVIDDEEVVAALSYKSNRNWTLPAPKVSLITPNTCNIGEESPTGVLTNDEQRMWITYIFSANTFTNSLHCNYYSYIDGPATGCTTNSQDVAVRFRNEFPFLIEGGLSGFVANNFIILCQITDKDERPNPTLWKQIDYTSQITLSGGYIVGSGMSTNTFVITNDLYTSASTYDLSNYISIPELGYPNILNFGDEYYFYGNLETDISATIYEMRYLITLGRNQFTNTSNPTWTSGTTSTITEIGLFDANKDLLMISKLQSPQKRQGIQQFLVKYDF